VREEDRRNPGGIDEVAALEADEDFDAVCDGDVQPSLELVGDGEVQLPLHSHFAALGIEVYLADLEDAHRRPLRRGVLLRAGLMTRALKTAIGISLR
jgi:hypothetical protein